MRPHPLDKSPGISCARAGKAFATFLQDFDGRLPRPWKLNNATGTFTRGVATVGFRVKRTDKTPNPGRGRKGQPQVSRHVRRREQRPRRKATYPTRPLFRLRLQGKRPQLPRGRTTLCRLPGPPQRCAAAPMDRDRSHRHLQERDTSRLQGEAGSDVADVERKTGVTPRISKQDASPRPHSRGDARFAADNGECWTRTPRARNGAMQ